MWKSALAQAGNQANILVSIPVHHSTDSPNTLHPAPRATMKPIHAKRDTQLLQLWLAHFVGDALPTVISSRAHRLQTFRQRPFVSEPK